MLKDSKPPYCNTGALNTKLAPENGLRMLIDWASFTLHADLEIFQVANILGLEFDEFQECDHGDKGYMSQLRNGNITILYNGKKGMGIHINMSGEGCREFEQKSCKDWSMFFALLSNFDVSYSRLDIAIDDFDNYLSVPKMKRYLRKGHVRSKFRTAREMRKTHIADGTSKGDTIYFGSPKSRIQVRFYDKLLERIEAGKEIEEGVTHWVRAEMQLRDERATTAAMLIANDSYEIGELAKGILNNYMAFVVDNGDKNKSRWPIAKFWAKFLDNAGKVKLSQKAPDKTIERSYNWIDNQVSTTMAMLFEAFDHDTEFIQHVIEEGYEKLTKDHIDIINRYKSQFKHKYEKGRLQTFEEFSLQREKDKKRKEALKNKKAQTAGNDLSL